MRTKRFALMSLTPLSPMVGVLLVLVVYVVVDLRHQHQTWDKAIREVRRVDRRGDHSPLLSPPPPPPPPPTPTRHEHRHPHAHEAFRKVGFLTSRELADSVILPLFGDAAPYRRHRWNYYTVTDTRQSLSSVKLPVLHRDRSCVDEVACEELYTGDVVRVHGYESPFVVHVY